MRSFAETSRGLRYGGVYGYQLPACCTYQRHRQLHLAPRCHALYVPPYKVRGTWHHRCAVTNSDTPRSNCEHGQQGTFSLGYLPSWSAMAGACLRRCAACKGCSFISLSVWTTKITRTRPEP